MRSDAPQISGSLGRGQFVSVSSRIGVDVEGYVCDRDETGLLLDVRDQGGNPAGYEFLPWSGVERVSIKE